MNDTLEFEVEVTFNENVMMKILQTALLPEDQVIQEVSDSVFAGMMFLMTALEPETSGRLLGKIMAESMKNATKASGYLDAL